MKVHAFGLKRNNNSGNLEDLLKKIRSDELAKRSRTVGQTVIRLDHVDYSDGVWFFDFGRFRDKHGPGKASRTTPVRGFNFGKGEVFCEETACLYDPATRHVLVQYNHHGARAGKIQDYFNFYDNNNFNFELLPKYDESVEQRFQNRAATRKVIFEIDPRFLTEKDREKGTALTQAVDLGKQSQGQKVELVISAGKSRKNNLGVFVDKTIEALKKKAGNNPDGITKVQVGMLDHLDSKMEVLDLLEHRLVEEFDDIPVGSDLRFPQQERYKALMRALNGWKSVLKK